MLNSGHTRTTAKVIRTVGETHEPRMFSCWLHEALELVIACKRICEASGAPWMLENPVGSLSTYWRKPDFTFHPWEYTTPKEAKRTCIWAGNNFVIPQREAFTRPEDVQESVWKDGAQRRSG